MPILKPLSQSAPVPTETQQNLLFFKSYLRYLKHLISHSVPSEQTQTIFDLKKTSLSLSLQIFLQRVFSYFKCGIQPYVCALAFIDRFLQSQTAQNDHILLSIKNIFKILSVALLVATKNFDDFYYTNAYYARVCGLTLQELNTLEKQFLKIIDFDVFVDSKDYSLYEKLINKYKQSIHDEMALAERKQNMIDEENRTMVEKRNKFSLRSVNDCSQTENDTPIEVPITA